MEYIRNTLPGTPQNETLKTKPKNKLGVSKNEKRNSKNEAEKMLGISETRRLVRKAKTKNEATILKVNSYENENEKRRSPNS